MPTREETIERAWRAAPSPMLAWVEHVHMRYTLSAHLARMHANFCGAERSVVGVCACGCACACLCLCVSACVCVGVWTCASACMCVRECGGLLFVRHSRDPYLRVCTHATRPPCTQASTHARTHTHTHARGAACDARGKHGVRAEVFLMFDVNKDGLIGLVLRAAALSALLASIGVSCIPPPSLHVHCLSRMPRPLSALTRAGRRRRLAG